MHRRSLLVAVLFMIAATTVAPGLASSAPTQDPRAERERVRAERAQVASQIDTSKASLAEIDAALRVLEENLATQEAALARTEGELAQAVKEVADAEGAISTLTEEIAVLKVQMRERAVAAFVKPPGGDLLTVLEARDFTTASAQRFYISLRAQDDVDVADRLAGATSDIEYQRKKATEAEALAEDKLAEQAERTDAVRMAEADQQAVADGLQATIDAQIDRSIALAATDDKLSAQIAAQEAAALAARLAAIQAAQQAAAQEVAAQTVTPIQPGPLHTISSDGQVSNQAADGDETTPLPPVASSGSSGSSGAGVSLCTVGGITVNCRIEGALEGLLNAARANGLALSGGGYRNPSAQIALRQQHCGTSQYAIYQMPASQCSPPTAKPGQSQHELGLAIDFSNCSSRSSDCYKWLAANAAAHGFYNLPSEPWHWSTSGN